MANINTTQRFQAADLAPLAPLTTSPQIVQFPAKSQYGVGNAVLPLPDNQRGNNQKIWVRLFFDFKLATVAGQTLTVTISALNNAGASAIIATTGAVALAAQAGKNDSGFLEVELLLDSFNVNGTSPAGLRGRFSGVVAGSLVALAVLSNPPAFGFDNGSTTNTALQSIGWLPGQGFTFAATLNGADATSTFQITEVGVEVE
jgi:hypothetical protein